LWLLYTLIVKVLRALRRRRRYVVLAARCVL